MSKIIRIANEQDFDQIWPIFEAIVKRGDTYAYSVDSSKQDALQKWIHQPQETYVVEIDKQIVGTYYLKPNFEGPGSHICNCGYMVSESARGQGVASSMCEHSQQRANELGFKAMQFNYVASSNKGAVRLWQNMGFEEVGRLPKAFNHPEQGFVDALVMYKWLGE